jgi:hypothetical protein
LSSSILINEIVFGNNWNRKGELSSAESQLKAKPMRSFWWGSFFENCSTFYCVHFGE